MHYEWKGLIIVSFLSGTKDCNMKYLSDCCFSSQGCYLLLLLKQNLKKSFGLSDR